MIRFFISGRPVDPRNIKNALMRAVLEGVREQITEKVGAIRDADTGEFPTVIVRGDTIDKLTVHVEGSPKLIALARERLSMEAEAEAVETAATSTPPHAFLSYTSDDLDLARRIAEALQTNGIETW